MRLSDGRPHSIYRVVVDFSGSTTVLAERVQTYPHGRAWVNVKAESPSVAAEWVLSYPKLCRIPPSNLMSLVTAYKLRRQPVWLKKSGTLTARFDLRRLESGSK